MTGNIESWPVRSGDEVLAGHHVAGAQMLIGVTHAGEAHLHLDFEGVWLVDLDRFDVPRSMQLTHNGGSYFHSPPHETARRCAAVRL